MKARFLDKVEVIKKGTENLRPRKKISRILLLIDLLLIGLILISFVKRESLLAFWQNKEQLEQTISSKFINGKCNDEKCSFLITQQSPQEQIEIDKILKKTTKLGIEIFHHGEKILNLGIPASKLQHFLYEKKSFEYKFPWKLDDSYRIDLLFFKDQKRLTLMTVYPQN